MRMRGGLTERCGQQSSFGKVGGYAHCSGHTLICTWFLPRNIYRSVGRVYQTQEVQGWKNRRLDARWSHRTYLRACATRQGGVNLERSFAKLVRTHLTVPYYSPVPCKYIVMQGGSRHDIEHPYKFCYGVIIQRR